MRCPVFRWVVAIIFAPALGQTIPAREAATASSPAPASQPDLSSPKAALTAAYQALKVGDLAATKECLAFKDAGEAELFDITFSQLYTPLKLMHAMEAKFGPAGRQPFANAPLERSLDATLEQIPGIEVRITGDTAAVVDKKAEVNPSGENQLTGITFTRQNNQWKIVAGTFSDIADTGTMPPAQMALMRTMRDAIEGACQATGARLEKGDFKTAEEAYADYQGRIRAALQPALLTPGTGPTAGTGPATQK